MNLLPGWLAVEKIDRNDAQHQDCKGCAYQDRSAAASGRTRPREQAPRFLFEFPRLLLVLNYNGGFGVPREHDVRCIVALDYIRREPVTAAWNGNDVPALVWAFAERFPYGGYMQGQVGLFPLAVGPQDGHQLVLFKYFAVMLDQCEQRVESLGREGHNLVLAQQHPRSRINQEGAKPVTLTGGLAHS